jgi:hypothetical protein
MELWGVSGEVIVQGGAAGVLLLIVLGICFGWIVPSRIVTRLERGAAERLAQEKARGDEWRAYGEAQAERNDVLTEQVNALAEGARTTNALIEGLKQATETRLSQ